jgi:hypothetical protein
MTLPARHAAVQVFAAATSAFQVDANALHFVAFDLRGGLGNGGHREGENEEASLDHTTDRRASLGLTG